MTSSWTSRAMDVVAKANAFARRPVVSRTFYVIGALSFVVLAFVSFRSVPDAASWDWHASLALIVVGIPVAVYLNTAEYRTIAAAVDIHLDWRSSFVTATAAALANLLPIPGAAAVRTTAMVKRGGSAFRSGEVNILAAVNWVSIAGLMAAGTLIGHTSGTWTLPALVGGSAAGLVLSSFRLASISSWTSALELCAIEAGKVLISGARLFWAFKMIDSPVGLADSIAIGASHALASIAGFFPAGLGLREILAGGIAAAVDVSAEQAIAATIVDRIVGQIGLLVVLLLAALAPGSSAREVFRRGQPTAIDAGPDSAPDADLQAEVEADPATDATDRTNSPAVGPSRSPSQRNISSS
ncbi:MAG: hypothetical protein KDB86_05110 [Actinobacteria bacterium]|nr:hypothetical protein [Actinomycetota bacterium]MCB9390333.1 hypothetical protein [Acidimicrobiia bacterium]